MGELKVAIELLKRCRNIFQKENERLQKIMRKAPEGSLVIQKPHNKKYSRYIWQQCKNGKVSRSYLSKSKNLKFIQRLSDKKFAKTSIKNLNAALSAIDGLLLVCSNLGGFGLALADKLTKQGCIFSPGVAITTQEYKEKWKNSHTEFLHFHDNEKIHTNEDGCQYRSKSESMIATELRTAGITYLYDVRVDLPTGKVVYVDFILLHPETLEEIYFEHFGRFDDPGYMEDVNERLVHYSKSGIIHGKNFFYTHETMAQPLTKDQIIREINHIIHKYDYEKYKYC